MKTRAVLLSSLLFILLVPEAQCNQASGDNQILLTIESIIRNLAIFMAAVTAIVAFAPFVWLFILERRYETFIKSKSHDLAQEIRREATEYFRTCSEELRTYDQYKSLAILDIYESFSSSLEKLLRERPVNLDLISETTRYHFMHINHLILLFMPNREKVLRGLYYFAQNPDIVLRKEVLFMINVIFETDLEVLSALKKVENNYRIM